MSAEITQCIVLKCEEGRGAYGIRCDNDQNVYFPVSVTEGADLIEFDKVEAVVIKNDRPEPLWKAIKARKPDDN